MDVYLCGRPNARKQSVVDCLANKGFKVLQLQDENPLRPMRARDARGVASYDAVLPRRIRLVLDDRDSYRQGSHPNLTVMLRDATQTTSASQPHPITPNDTVERGASNHPRESPALSQSETMRGSYVLKHDLVVDITTANPIVAAQTIIEEARSFWNECNCGVIGPFREDYFFLSNMYPTHVAFDGLTYMCSESAYQAQKIDDVAIREQISQLDGKSAKRFMDHVTPRPGWGSECVFVMEQVLLAKFTQNDALRRKLASTAGFYLCELNRWNDNFFGVTVLPDGTIGHGLNMLGKALMRVRKSLCRTSQT